MTTRAGLRSWIAGILFAAGLIPVTAAAECKMIQLGTLPVTTAGNSLTIRGKVNGHEAVFLADTGAEGTVLSLEAAEQAGAHMKEQPGWKMVGFSGTAQMYRGKVEDLQFGDFHFRNQMWSAVSADALGDGLGGVLGADFWSQTDFEVDLAQSRIILWHTEGCERSSLAYWSENFMLAKLARGGDLVRADVKINGVRLRATLDTGATSTMINSSLARRIGFRTDSGAGNTEVAGMGSRGGIDAFVAVFDTFELGDLSIKNARMLAFDMDRHTKDFRNTRFGDSGPDLSDLLIGTDFLRANRVLVSNDQGNLYMTYNGGKVFQTEPPEADEAVNLPVAAQEPFRAATRAEVAGKFDEAENLYRQAIDASGANADAGTRLIVLWPLAGVLERQKKFAEAESVHLQLVPAAQQVFGEEGLTVALYLMQLGSVYDLEEKRAEATATFQWALAIIEKNTATNAEGAAAASTELGSHLSDSGRHAEAEAVYRRAQTLYEQTSGAYDPDTAVAMLNLGGVIEEQGRKADAAELYKRARKILKTKLGSDHELTRYSEEALARVEGGRSD